MSVPIFVSSNFDSCLNLTLNKSFFKNLGVLFYKYLNVSLKSGAEIIIKWKKRFGNS